jgi:hypothetical protein
MEQTNAQTTKFKLVYSEAGIAHDGWNGIAEKPEMVRVKMGRF